MTKREITGPMRKEFVVRLSNYIQQLDRENENQMYMVEDTEYKKIDTKEMISSCIGIKKDSLNRWLREAQKTNRERAFQKFEAFYIAILCTKNKTSFYTMLYWAGQDPLQLNKKYPNLMDEAIKLLKIDDPYDLAELLDQLFAKKKIKRRKKRKKETKKRKKTEIK